MCRTCVTTRVTDPDVLSQARQVRLFHSRKPRNQRERTLVGLFVGGLAKGQITRCPVTGLPMELGCAGCGVPPGALTSKSDGA